MTDSGVLMACARLPTWVRARSTISRLASISALVSRASGAISTGNSPSSRSARPERISAIEFRDALERRQTEADLEDGGEQQHDAERGEGAAEIVVEAARLVENLRGVAGDADQEFAVRAEIDRPFHHAQVLALRAVDIADADAGGGQLDAVVFELRQLLVPQRARGAHIGLVGIGAGDLPVPARQRQLEQGLAERLELAVRRLVRGGDLGDRACADRD